MSDVFISYSVKDKIWADAFYNRLTGAGLEVFMDSKSLEPGTKWSDRIKENLSSSEVLLFLASRNSLASPNANQEFGMAMKSGLQIIPVVWELQPAELPQWVKDYQAIVLTGKSIPDARAEVDRVINQLVINKQNAKTLAAMGIIGVAALVLYAATK